MNKTDIIAKTIYHYPEVVEHLTDETIAYYHSHKAIDRDPKEPGLDKKTAREKKLSATMKKRLSSQRADVIRLLDEGVTIQIADLAESKYNAELMRLYTDGYIEGIDIAAQQAGVPYDAANLQGILLENANTWVSQWLTNIDTVTLTNVRQALNTFAQVPGTTIGDVVNMLEPTFGEVRANRIAVTEITRMYAESNQLYAQEIEKLFPGTQAYKKWNTNNDDIVCPICGSLNGKKAKTGESFTDYAGKQYSMPPAHVNCILPGNEVYTPDLIGATKAFYNGAAIEFGFASGGVLSVTENHPILTADGWIAAKFLNVGDYALGSSNAHRIADAINPNNDNIPTAIEQVFGSLKESNQMGAVSMKSTTKDFYGDGKFIQGDVEIVNVDSFLLRDRIAKIPQMRGENNLIVADITERSLSAGSAPGQFINSGNSSLGSSMSSGDLRNPRFWTHKLPLDKFAFTLSPGNDLVFEQQITEGRPAHTDLSREFVLRFSGDIAPDQIISVSKFDYSGHVYDLQSVAYELFITNNIITKNCRCWITTELK